MSTNFATGVAGTVVEPYFTNSTLNATTGELNIILARCTVANLPTGAGYAVGCIIQASDTGDGYVNKGTVTAANFVLLDSGTSFGLPTAATDSTTTTGNSFALTQNAVTSGTGLLQVMNGLTTGKGRSITHTTAVISAGGTLDNISSTSIDTSTTSGILQNLTSTASLAGTQRLLTASALTTGIADSIVVAALTTGIGSQVKAAIATLTTGRYYSANDGATEVFGVGLNGHIISTVSASVPTIAVSAQNGITAAAITAGGSDTAGVITTTGTNNNGGATVLQVTFGKTYTTAPKAVLLFPANASAAKAAATSLATPYISATAATTFDITIPADASAGATPSWRYVVIA